MRTHTRTHARTPSVRRDDPGLAAPSLGSGGWAARLKVVTRGLALSWGAEQRRPARRVQWKVEAAEDSGTRIWTFGL